MRCVKLFLTTQRCSTLGPLLTLFLADTSLIVSMVGANKVYFNRQKSKLSINIELVNKMYVSSEDNLNIFGF